jgi:hypothetical protein
MHVKVQPLEQDLQKKVGQTEVVLLKAVCKILRDAPAQQQRTVWYKSFDRVVKLVKMDFSVDFQLGRHLIHIIQGAQVDLGL